MIIDYNNPESYYGHGQIEVSDNIDPFDIAKIEEEDELS